MTPPHNPYYEPNPNLQIKSWIRYLIIFSSIISLTLAGLTFAFQMSHPKSRRNMGRFFLIILAFQSFDKINAIIQELFIYDLSLPYYEIQKGLHHVSPQTKVCQIMGAISVFCDYMSQFYALWFAVLIQQIIKDPIHRLQKLICFFHTITFLISSSLMVIVSKFNTFGVQENLQCGLMFIPGQDDDILMMLPFVLIPMQIFFITKIIKQTPFIIRQSLKRFVRKYAFYVTFLMSMQCMQVVIVVFGARNSDFFSYEKEDGFKRLRYGYIIVDHCTYFCLVCCTIYEPVFIKKAKKFIARLRRRKIQYNIQDQSLQVPFKRLNTLEKNQKRRTLEQPGQDAAGAEGGNQSGEEHSNSMIFVQDVAKRSITDSDSDFEDGFNKKDGGTELDIIDKSKLEHLISEAYNNFDEKFNQMSIKQKTNYFIINTVLMSICHCFISGQDQDNEEPNLGLGVIKRAFRYQLKENDINHIMDMAEFYKKNSHLCVSDVTDGKKVQIKIEEYEPTIVKKIRKKSGFDDKFLIQAFSPKENHFQMTRFNIGSGKSDSFFFNTANSQFIIKTLKEEECTLLVRKGILEKYYKHIRKNPNSMLARFYGIFTVKIKFMKPISVVIMDNLMGEHIEDIISIYDLKGSTHKRRTKQIKNVRTVKKDLNFLLEPEFFMHVDSKQKKEFISRLQKDKEFLKSCNLMDYSLLMIFLKKHEIFDEEQQYTQTQSQTRKLSFYIKREANGDEIEMEEVPEHLARGNSNSRSIMNFHHPTSKQLVPPNKSIFDEDQDARPMHSQQRSSIFDDLERSDSNDSHHSSSQNRVSYKHPRINEFVQFQHDRNPNYYYRLGIIDFLQAYTRRKKLETLSLRYRYKTKPKDCFSCVPPDTYGDRFYNFLSTNLFTQDRVFPECEIEKNEKQGNLIYQSLNGLPKMGPSFQTQQSLKK